MAVTFVAASTGTPAGTTTSAGTAGVTPALPAGTAVGDRVFIVQGSSNTAGATPAGWIRLVTDQQVGPTGTAAGAGTGRRYLNVYYRDYDGAWTMPAVTLTSATNNSNAAGAITLRRDAIQDWKLPTASTAGNTSAASTAYSVTIPSFATATGAMLLTVSALNDQVTTAGQTLSQAGATLANLTEQIDSGTATGNDVQLIADTVDVATGATATLARTATLSAASEGGTIVVQQEAGTPAIVDAVSALGSVLSRWRADQITGVADGAGVASWPDASVNAIAATQGAPASQPTFKEAGNGIGPQPAVRFAAANSTGLASAARTIAPTTIVTVLRPYTLGANRSIRGADGNTNGLLLRSYSAGTIGFSSQNAADFGTSTGSISTSGTPQYTVSTYDAGSGAYAHRINGAPAGSGTSVQAINTTRTANLGRFGNAGGEFLDADVAEIIVFSRVLTASEITTVESYIQGQYFSTAVGAAGSVTLGGSTTPTARASGTTGSITLAGSATGTVPGTPATATGTVALSGGPSPAATPPAGGTITLAGTATPAATRTSAGSITLAGAPAARAAATASGTVTLSGSVTPAAPATTTGTVTLGGTASGRAPATTTGAITLAGTATGTQPGSSAAGSITLGGAAAPAAVASSAGTVTLSGGGTPVARAALGGLIVLGGTPAPGTTGTTGGVIVLGGAPTARVPATVEGLILLGGLATAVPGIPFRDITVTWGTPTTRTLAGTAHTRTLGARATIRELSGAARTRALSGAARTRTLTGRLED